MINHQIKVKLNLKGVGQNNHAGGNKMSSSHIDAGGQVTNRSSLTI